MARSTNRSQFPTVATAGGLLPADFLLLLKTGIERQSGSDIPGLQPTDYHLGGETFGEATNRAWNALQGRWEHFKAYLDEKDDADTTHGETWDRFLRPLFRELGYGQLERNLAVEIDDDTYKITHHWRGVAIHLLGAGISIDKRTPGAEGAAKKSPHAMVQEFLNRSDDHLWAFVANGLRLRILRDNVSLTRQAYVEFDLFAMFEGGEYADFQLLWLLCHQSRVEGTPPETCWLERWATEAKQRGVRMLDGLRDGVEKSISALGEGFLEHPDNRALRERLTSGELSTQDYYRQVLRIVYRLIFLFVAEDRNLLLVTDAPDETKRRYRRHYATDRLRELAQRRRGSVHPDLWEQLKLIMRALGSPEGQPALALPALGSFLWDAERSTPDLADVTLSNTYLLDAIRALATVRTEKERVRRVVDYRNLGAEELGSVYESLLELHPQINLDARTFALDSSAGNDRKTSGSYYTPDSLVQCLLDTALEPVIKDRLAEARKANHANSAEVKATAQEQALLDLKVCDPAVGSGHFLIAAGHRIARHLARIRSGEEEPSPADYQDALRDVVGRCLYGVDLNPMAVELCKVSLWIEAMEPGKPLSFLDHHIRCGNSLLGTTPALIEKGIPDGAYKALTGDDKEACAFLKKRNKGEREGIGGLFVAEDSANLDALRSAAESVESIADDSIKALQRKEQEYRKAEMSYERLKQKKIADLWCAAFVWEKNVLEENANGKCTKATGVTTSHLQRLARGGSLPEELLDQLRLLANDYQFFHWHVEFPSVFRVSGENDMLDQHEHGFSGGFDALLGNPPWDQIELKEQEFFSSSSPEIASARTAAMRKKKIEALRERNPILHAEYSSALRHINGQRAFLTNSGRSPLCGKGRINCYAVFAELLDLLVHESGRVGVVCPSGIATDDNTKDFFSHLMTRGRIASLFDFENKGLFEALHSSYKFCLLTLTGQAADRRKTSFAFFAHDVADIGGDRVFSLSLDDLNRINPNSQTCPVFRSRLDAELSLRVHNYTGILHVDDEEHEDGWRIRRIAMPNVSDDSRLFESKSSLEDAGFERIGEIYRNDDATFVSFYEAKMFNHYDHRAADVAISATATARQGQPVPLSSEEHRNADRYAEPRHWFPETRLGEITDREWGRRWMFAWRDLTASTNSRTLVPCILPRVAFGRNNAIPLFPCTAARSVACLLSALSSFVVDYAGRQKLGGLHATIGFVDQIPIPPPQFFSKPLHWKLGACAESFISARVAELSYTAWDLESFAQDCGYDGPPFRWDEERRFQLRCELDALIFHLYLPCDDAGDWKPARIADGAVRDETDEELATLKSHFPTPRDAVAYIMETFPIVKRKDIAHTEQKDPDGNITREGTYLTKDRILEIYDQMLQARREGREWQSPLDPPPGPPTDAEGNFIPMAEWTHHPSHIHPPKGEALPQDALHHFTDLANGDVPATTFPVALPDDLAAKVGGQAWTIEPLAPNDPLPSEDEWVVVAHPDLQRRDEPCGGIAAGKLSRKERTDATTGETYIELTLKGPIPPATLRLTPEEAKTFRPLGIIRTQPQQS